MSSNKENDSPCLSVSVDQSEIRGSDEKDFKESKLNTQVLLEGTARVKRTKNQDFDASSNKKVGGLSNNINIKSNVEQTNQPQYDLNQVKNQVKEALVENKKKKRGGKKHKKDKKDINKENEQKTSVQVSPNLNSMNQNINSSSRNSKKSVNINESQKDRDQNLEIKGQKSPDALVYSSNILENKPETKSNSVLDNVNEKIDIDESVNQESTLLETDSVCTNNEYNLDKTNKSNTLDNIYGDEGLNKVKSYISFYQEGMEKDKTFELKDSFNFNNTLKSSEQGQRHSVDCDIDKLRTQDDLDENKLIITGVDEVQELSDNGNEKYNEQTIVDFKAQRESGVSDDVNEDEKDQKLNLPQLDKMLITNQNQEDNNINEKIIENFVKDYDYKIQDNLELPYQNNQSKIDDCDIYNTAINEEVYQINLEQPPSWVTITKLVDTTDYKIESTETADFKDNNDTAVNISQIDLTYKTSNNSNNYHSSPTYKNNDYQNKLNSSNNKNQVSNGKSFNHNHKIENSQSNKSNCNSSPQNQTKPKENNNNSSNCEYTSIFNDKQANTLTGYIRESQTKSMTIVKKTEDSLQNMRNKQMKKNNLNDTINARLVSQDSNTKQDATFSNNQDSNSQGMAINNLTMSKSEDINIISGNISTSSPNKDVAVPVKQGNQDVKLNSHFYKSQGNLRTSQSNNNSTNNKDISNVSGVKSSINQNQNQINNTNILNDIKINDNVIVKDEHLSAKKNSSRQLNDLNDEKNPNSLSRSKSKLDLLNKSITRSNPRSEKRYADFRQDEQTENIIIDRKSSKRNSEKRVEFNPHVEFNYDNTVSKLTQDDNKPNQDYQFKEIKYNQISPSSKSYNVAQNNKQEADTFCRNVDQIKDNLSKNYENDSQCRKIDSLTEEIKERSVTKLKYQSQTKSEKSQRSDNVRDELNELKNKYLKLQSDYDSMKTMNTKQYEILTKFNVQGE